MKHAKIILAAVAISAAMNLSFAGAIKPGVPKGWVASVTMGTYFSTGIDPSEQNEGHHAVFIESKPEVKDQVGALTQTIDATPWHGQLVELTVTSKALDDASTAEMWIRGSDGAAGPGHFNSVATSKLNSKGWKETKIGMVIDEKVSQLQIGFGLRGTGKVWVREIKFQALPASTKQELEKKRRIDQEIPLGPVTTTLTNLQFIE